MHKFAVALVAAAFAPFAFSQTNEPLSRASVKAETRSLESAGKLVPAGEGSFRAPETRAKSTLSRAERKAATRLAAKNHELIPAGAAGTLKADAALRAQPTTRSRAERKAETRLAAKEHKLVPAGEASEPLRP